MATVAQFVFAHGCADASVCWNTSRKSRLAITVLMPIAARENTVGREWDCGIMDTSIKMNIRCAIGIFPWLHCAMAMHHMKEIGRAHV